MIPPCHPQLPFGYKVVEWIALLLVCVAAGGCQKDAAPRAAAKPQVRVAAAANLKFMFDEIAAEFRAHSPSIDVAVTYGSSGNFFAQLSNKAPFDLFLSADVDYPRQLVEKGVVKNESAFTYAVGRLVVWVPNSSKLDLEVHGIESLLDPSVRKIAIANPRHAPYGRAAEAALKKLGVYERIQDQLVLGDNLEQAAHFVESGAADAGMIGLSLAVAAALKDKGRYWLVPTGAYPPLTQAGVVLPWAQNREAAEQLRAFLLGARGQELFKKYGYDIPSSAGE